MAAARAKKATRPKAGGEAAEASGKAQTNSAETAANAVDEQLARYRSMRDFQITAEPSGSAKEKTPASALPFCVQKHAASHLHYDFRLGWNGVLKSWAVAKGPSYVTADKRLAVQVEDHPIEYGGFEGIIPAGQYGGGTVMLWDQGTWEPQAAYPDVEDGLRKGSLKFILHGTKLQGKWALIRIGGRSAGSSSKPNWLLIKEHDPLERSATDPAVTEAEVESVVTGRTMEQIAHSEDHVWNSKETVKPGQPWYRQESKSSAEPKSRVADASRASPSKGGVLGERPKGFDSGAVAKLPKESQPGFLAPQLAQQAETPPANDGWLHELKLDGYRIQARKSGNNVQLLTRTGLDWTHRMTGLAAEIARIPAASATLDGEVVVLSADGTSSFADLQGAFQNDARNAHLTYFAFDLLHVNDRNPRELPLRERKSLLDTLVAGADPDVLRLSEHLESNGEAIFRKACEMRAEGIVSKLASSKYCAGRSSSWLKCKCLHEQEFVIGGYSLPGAGHTGMRGVGALMLGYYRDGKLIYAGRTGTGFTQKTHKLLRDKLEELGQAAAPFDRPPAEARRGAKWVRPELVAQVRFATWTADALVRQAAFLGLREDKPAGEVTREDAAPVPKGAGRGYASGSADGDSRGEADQAASANGVAYPAGLGRSAEAASGLKARAEHARTAQAHSPIGPIPKTIRLTHPAKILDRESSLTKQQLADYYWAIAPRMLPHIAGRPISLVRCPDGAGSPCFFQKHVNAMLPQGIGSVDVADKKTGKIEPYITVDSAENLASLAQLGVLEIHPWGSSNGDLEHPDRLIFDLDPDQPLPWATVTAAAAEVRARLKKLGLTSFLKTTGGKGLHIVIPIEPTLDWSAAKNFAHAFVSAMERASPRLYLTKMSKAARAGKIYLDYLRNERGATAVAPYSPRARAGCGVSMPLAWTELTAPKRPVFRVANFAEWRSRLGKDPWKAIGSTRQAVAAGALGLKG